MPITGKYDFKGIKDKGAKGILLALSSVAWVATAFAKLPVLRGITDFVLEALVNWGANKGLIVLNIGDIIVEGEIDQNRFDNAMEDGLSRVKVVNGRVLTPAEKKAIDDKVIKAFRNLGLVTKHN